MASFTERYHEATKYNPYSIDRLGSVDWGEQPPPFKSMEGGTFFSFAQYLPFLKKVLGECLLDSPTPPESCQFGTLPSLAHLVYLTAGITGLLRTENGSVHFRANPSAGGLYPVELYFAVRGWRGLPDGLYYFHPLLCGAVPVANALAWDEMSAQFADRETVAESQLVFFMTGVFERSLWRYKERSYRRILLDAGCMLANVRVHAWSQGLQCRLLGGFRDDFIESLLDLTRGEVPLLALAVGKNFTSPLRPQAPSLPPGLAVQRLREASYPGLFLQQNRVERITDAFMAPPPMGIPAVVGARIPLLPCIQDDAEVVVQLPRLGLLRRSCRKFVSRSIGPDSLGAILQLAYRFYLQQNLGGDLLKSWLVVHSVDGLDSGVYRYLPAEHALVLVRTGDLRPAMHEIALGQALAEDCAVLLVHTADLNEATAQYGDRVYRYLKADAGSLGQAVNLFAGMFQLGASGIGAYFDDMCNQVLELPASDSILYMTTLGVPGGNT